MPFKLADLLPSERELYLRVFSGNSAYSRRRAVRAWQHKLSVKRERARTGTSPRRSLSADLVSDQQETG